MSMRSIVACAALLGLAPAVVHAQPKKAPLTAERSASNGAKRQVAAATSVTPKPRQLRFLGLDPHGPLAAVTRGKLHAPARGACRSWASIGGRWASLDALGQVVGEVEITAMERYDVTNCDELALETRSGKDGVGVYASRGYAPMPLRTWKMEAGERAALEALVGARDAKLPRIRGGVARKGDLPLDRRLLTWETPAGEQFAVVGGRGLTVLRMDRDRWRVLHEIQPKKDEVGHADMFRPLSALDMDGDGRVEIVVHERDVDAYADFTLTPSEHGYRVIDAGIHGAFA